MASNANLIDTLTAEYPPELQSLLRAALSAIITPEFRRVMAGIDTYKRASLLVAWKESVKGLRATGLATSARRRPPKSDFF